MPYKKFSVWLEAKQRDPEEITRIVLAAVPDDIRRAARVGSGAKNPLDAILGNQVIKNMLDDAQIDQIKQEFQADKEANLTFNDLIERIIGKPAGSLGPPAQDTFPPDTGAAPPPPGQGAPPPSTNPAEMPQQQTFSPTSGF